MSINGVPEGIEALKALARSLDRPLESLFVLDARNDPFIAGRPSRKGPAEWFADLYARLQIQPGAHIRRIFYVLVSQPATVSMVNGEPFENTLECWSALVSAARDARYLGLIPARAIVDRRNPAPVLNLEEGENIPAEISILGGGIVPSVGLDYYRPAKLSLPTLYLDGPTIKQPFHIEIWCEKSTMNDVLLPLGMRFGVNIVTGVGEMSATACETLVHRAQRSGHPVRILYVSDFDPAGRSMPVAVARKIEYFARGCDLDIQVQPVVLTPEQCVEYELPRTPLKQSELRARRFEARFGAGATELDALEAIHPGRLGQILAGEIDRYYDHDLADRINEAVDDANDELNRMTSEVHARYSAEIEQLEAERTALDRDVQNDLRMLRQKFAPKEKAFAERAQRILDAMTNELGEQAPNAAEFDWPEPIEPDDLPDPLYDSSRPYIEQIERYHAYQGKPTDVTSWRDREIVSICTECGKSFTACRIAVKVCSPLCRSRRAHRISRERQGASR